MALITVEGIYENGKVELAELPEGVDRAKVRVTFLPEANPNRTKHVGKAGILQARGEVTQERYPPALREEYVSLIHKKLNRMMTTEEAARLEIVRTEINQRDSQSGAWSAWEQRTAEIDTEFARIRQELETLPEA